MCQVTSRSPDHKIEQIVDFFILKILPSVLSTQLYLAFLAFSCTGKANEEKVEIGKEGTCRAASQVSNLLGCFALLGGIAKFVKKLMDANGYNAYPHITAHDITTLNLPWALLLAGVLVLATGGFVIYLVSWLGKASIPSVMMLVSGFILTTALIFAMVYEVHRFSVWSERNKDTANTNKDAEEEKNEGRSGEGRRGESIDIGSEIDRGMSMLPVS